MWIAAAAVSLVCRPHCCSAPFSVAPRYSPAAKPRPILLKTPRLKISRDHRFFFFRNFFAIQCELFFQKCEKSIIFLDFGLPDLREYTNIKVTIFKIRFQQLANKIKG
jgi:hypothetical protein